MKILIYTFRSTLFIKMINKVVNKEIYILSKINNDLEKFYKIILINKPTFILGLAKTNKNYSQFEKYTFNKFGKDRVLIKNGIYKYKLYIPSGVTKLNFHINCNIINPSFCNLSAYKISSFLQREKLDTKLIFLHIREEDINKLNLIISILK
jgi:hypothetical protein